MSRLLGEQWVIAVDFDGTISTEPDMGKPLVLQENCREVLSVLHDQGARLILWTCRTGKALEEAMQFLHDEDMLYLFDVINDQLPEINAKYAPDVARKVGADIYIDDKNLGFISDWYHIGAVLRVKGVILND